MDNIKKFLLYYNWTRTYGCYCSPHSSSCIGLEGAPQAPNCVPRIYTNILHFLYIRATLVWDKPDKFICPAPVVGDIKLLIEVNLLVNHLGCDLLQDVISEEHVG